MKRARRAVLAIALLMLFFATVNGQDEQTMDPITLHFAATVGEEMARCGEQYFEIGIDEAELSFNDFRFYVSNIHLMTASGDAVPMTLIQDGIWQFENIALLDFEDGTASCSEVGNDALNGEVVGMVPTGDYVGLRFDLGVPFEFNHAEVTTAASPLNIAALWWNWQGGYKFIRVDAMTHAESDAAWNIHIGSTGCDSPVGTIPPESECSRPNIATIVFDEFEFESDVIVADLAGLLASVPLYENTPMPPGCMSGVDDPDCPALYDGLGLSLEDGTCQDDDCSEQTFFRVMSVAEVELVSRTHTQNAMSDEVHSSSEYHDDAHDHQHSDDTAGETDHNHDG